VGSSSNALVFHQDIPENAKKEFERGMKSFEKNDFNGAAQALKKAIEIFPDYYDALEVLGTEYVKHNDYNSAMPLLEKAVAVNKDGWRGFYSLGVAKLETKQREEGIKSLKRAAELNPDSANINMRLGMALAVDDSARSEAIQAFERVKKTAKDSIPNVYFYLGALYSRNNQYKEAADAWETFLKLYPQTPEKENIKKMIEQFRQKAKAQGAK
jgi:tetratricopeptide (TPR) repeat protein